jgi:hypothetical protein
MIMMVLVIMHMVMVLWRMPVLRRCLQQRHKGIFQCP